MSSVLAKSCEQTPDSDSLKDLAELVTADLSVLISPNMVLTFQDCGSPLSMQHHELKEVEG